MTSDHEDWETSSQVRDYAKDQCAVPWQLESHPSNVMAKFAWRDEEVSADAGEAWHAQRSV